LISNDLQPEQGRNLFCHRDPESRLAFLSLAFFKSLAVTCRVTAIAWVTNYITDVINFLRLLGELCTNGQRKGNSNTPNF
jgi:hypothetical protein